MEKLEYATMGLAVIVKTTMDDSDMVVLDVTCLILSKRQLKRTWAV